MRRRKNIGMKSNSLDRRIFAFGVPLGARGNHKRGKRQSDAVSFSHGVKAANSGVYLSDLSRERDRAFSITAVGPADQEKTALDGRFHEREGFLEFKREGF